MRKRDLGILILSIFSVFISFQHEGSFSFKEGFYYPLDESSNPVEHESERLPPPVVVDLNGDGHSEIVLATHDAKLQVFDAGLRHLDGSFKDAHLLADTSMLPAQVRVATGRQPVALAAGFLDAPLTKNGKKVRRKAVIVVVTAGWSILCYDHNLKLLWENNVQEDFPHGSTHKEVAILIGNQTMRHGDRGFVIVGGSMEVHPERFIDPFEEEDEFEYEGQRHRRQAEGEEKLEDVSDGKAGMKERHFSYYAYNGGNGDARWKHESQDFHRDGSALGSKLLPQHNYKLDANALSSRHFGEVECKEYRESVLGAMPHRWERREDTQFELAHFRKHRRRPHKSQPGHVSDTSTPPAGISAKLAAGKDSRNVVANAVNKVVNLAGSGKRKRIVDPTHGNATGHWWAPNAVVVHLKEGIEAIHLYSGRTICKLLLRAGGLHADINGDGVLDHVQASGAHGGEQMVATGLSEPLKACWAIATSGVPVREQLFNGSICRSRGNNLMQQEFGSRGFGLDDLDNTPLEVATPIILPLKDKHRHRKGSHGAAIFLNSHGDVTAYEAEGGLHSHHGRLRWQVATEARWENPGMPNGIATELAIPTLKAMALRKGGPPEVILVAGETSAVVLSPNGHKEASFSFASNPTVPLLIADFNDDGLNDIMLLSTYGIYGYVQVRQPGAVLFSALLGFLVVCLSVLFVTQNFGNPKGKTRGDRRSTD